MADDLSLVEEVLPHVEHEWLYKHQWLRLQHWMELVAERWDTLPPSLVILQALLAFVTGQWHRQIEGQLQQAEEVLAQAYPTLDEAADAMPSAEAHHVLPLMGSIALIHGMVALQRRDWERGDAQLQKALSLLPMEHPLRMRALLVMHFHLAHQRPNLDVCIAAYQALLEGEFYCKDTTGTLVATVALLAFAEYA